MNSNLKKIPKLATDEEAEEFVANADLTEYDLSEFKPVRFEFAKKDAVINMRIDSSLLQSIKQKAQRLGITYTRYIRMLIEQDLQEQSYAS